MIGVQAASREDDGAGHGRASERDHWIALSLVDGVGPAGFSGLLHRYGTAAAAWAAGDSALRDLPHMTSGTLAASRGLRGSDPREVARRVEARTRDVGGRVVTTLDATYPPALLNLDPRPPVLYVRGSDAAFQERAVAIVGTRGGSGYGLASATEIAAELAMAGTVVVSGLALGIDGAAHRAAVSAGKPTIAVLPSSLDKVYPPRHRGLAREIVACGGALVTEVPIGMPIGRPDFARRNRIIAGLAEAVVVVEAPDRSGALMTASAGASMGREVYAVPGPIDAASSRGCNRLIADRQAQIVTSAGALLREIGLSRCAPPPAVAALSEVEGQLLRRLLERSGSLEELVDRCHQPPAAVASGLSLLEARGLVNAFGGATFHPTLAAKRLAGLV
jgi:DNA processing protein